MPASSTIASISVATIQGQLPAPVVFGDWIMKQREFVVVRVRADSGHEGWAFTLTRDGAVAEQIRKTHRSGLSRHRRRRSRAHVPHRVAAQPRLALRRRRPARAVDRRPRRVGCRGEDRRPVDRRVARRQRRSRCRRPRSSAIPRRRWGRTEIGAQVARALGRRAGGASRRRWRRRSELSAARLRAARARGAGRMARLRRGVDVRRRGEGRRRSRTRSPT